MPYVTENPPTRSGEALLACRSPEKGGGPNT